MMKVVVVGNNVAGTNVAKALRDSDKNLEIDILTEEHIQYYPRPKLIDYLAGTVDEKALPFYPLDWYEKNGLRLHLGSRVDRLDLAGKTVHAGGKALRYDKLVLATGSSAFLPPLKGLPKERVFTLRTIDDARRMREAAASSKHAVVIGGGLLGLESARAVCQANPSLKVTVLEYAEHLLMRQLDHEGAKVLQRWIEELGTKVLTKAETDEVMGSGTVTGVRLKDGRVIDCDMVIVSAGTRANTGLAKDAGLKVNRGIVVDGSLRTSDPDVYALGDAIELDGRTWGIIPPALEQAKVAAKKMLGLESPDYKGTVPSNTLKVMGFDLASIGTVRSEHEQPESGFEEIRATTQDGKVYKKFVIRDGRMIGAILLGTKKEVNRVTKMIKDGEPVDAVKPRLSDPGFSF